MTKPPKSISALAYGFYILLLIFPCSELALRVLRYQPFHQVAFHIEASPENCIIPHHSLGFALQPGQFRVTLNKGLQYDVRHGSDSLRVTSYSTDLENDRDSIYFFGCSYTYGMGISDSLSFPFLVQKNKEGCFTKNFGVPGYGTVQSYLQLKQLIDRKEIPSTIIINYADFHDDRNALTPAYRRDLFLGYQRSHSSIASAMQQANIPFIEKQKSTFQLSFNPWDEIYDNWNYRETFALVNFLQEIVDQRQTRTIKKEESSIYAFEQIQSLCDQHQIRMIVTGLTPSKKTKTVLQTLKNRGIETLDISVELSLDKYKNAPYDDHPNGHSHAIFAERIIRYLATFG